MGLITSMVEKYGSVLDWQTVEHSDQVLESVALDDIWGISKKWKNKQQTIGIQNALMIKCSNILECITIVNGFIPNWAMLARKLLKLKRSLSYVFVKSG